MKDAIIRCIAAKTGWTYQRALKYVQDMQQTRRYQRSEWGLQESPKKTIASSRFRIWAKSVLVLLSLNNHVKSKKKNDA